jgi:hypothetical protein
MKNLLMTTIVLFFGQSLFASVMDSDGILTGYIPPPEPDPRINNATLEGIDNNHNGVRDDVERKIYEYFPKKLHRALVMDAAAIFHNIAISSTGKAKEIEKQMSRSIHCHNYLRALDREIYADNFDYIEFLENYTFNTEERVQKYLDYINALSGRNFIRKQSDWNRDECSDEIIKTLNELGK